MRIVDRDLGWRRLGKALRDTSAVAVDVGVRADGAARADGGPSNAEIGAWHEYGTSTVPKRSWLRATYDRNWPIYAKMGRLLADQVLVGRLDKRKALTIVGVKFASDIKARIRAGIPPALADSTIERKGSSKQLIDTGQLIGSISHKVVGAAGRALGLIGGR